MANSSLFVGMVTHARSRFNVDGAAGAMARGLATHLRDIDVRAEVVISDRNDYNARTMPLSRRTLLHSAFHQTALEHRWRRYLVDGGGEGRSAFADLTFSMGMAGKRSVASVSAEPAAVRLLNIDLSHLRLMAASESSGAEWALILEDDAGATDLLVAAQQVARLMSVLDDTCVGFASLSESLSHDALGVSGLLHPANDIGPVGPGYSLWRTSRPITNTVCATLYRSSYLRMLRSTILKHGLRPVAPIDWRVNEAIMDLYSRGELDGDSCIWVRPGIFVQRSMHELL